MKLHLPSSLRTALLSCLSAAFVLTTGSGMLQAGEQELTFNGATLNWTTAPDNQVFTAADSSPAAFAPGDNVYFTGTTQVTLGEDIAVGILGVEAGAHVDITPGAYALKAERIELSGTLDYGSALHIGEGQTLAVESADSVLDSALVLQDNGAIEVSAVANLNNNSLSMQGGTALSLDTTGDGRVYNIFTGVSSLLDAQGNTLVLNTTNNAVSNYFDTTRPGTGFWAGATLQLTTDGTLQLVRHSETVKAAVEFTTRQTGIADYSYYDKVAFNDISSSSSGGAIYGGVTLSHNGSVTFCGNTASVTLGVGGAIYGSEYSTITLNNNGSVTFSGNSVSGSYAYGGAIYGGRDSTISLSNNGAVTFSGNTAEDTGGAIYGNDNNTITLNNNGSVTFSGNSVGAYADGGAIYGGRDSTITLNNNGSVTFSGNTAEHTGGAIYGNDNNTITLNNNGSVTFSGNTGGTTIHGGINSTISLSNNGFVTFYGNTAGNGGAIYGDTISLSNNRSVTFNGNTGGAIQGGINSTISLSNNGFVTFYGNTDGNGGAIFGGTISLSNNGSVTFSGNTAEVSGGAIFFGGGITLSNNGSVVFEGNTAYSGAVYGNGDITLTNNGSVTFYGNTGGAICGHDDSDITLNNNNSVTFAKNIGGAIKIWGNVTLQHNYSLIFSENKKSAYDNDSVYGGAIYGNDITLSDCSSILFRGNKSLATPVTYHDIATSKGGAIYANDTLTLSNNGSVIFSGNIASAYADVEYSARGGAIYADGTSNLSIRNNDSVLFEKNAEITNGNYRLRSIHAAYRNDIYLSAAAGKNIEFRDSVYIASGSRINLNADYTNSESNVIKQEGDIIFTGAYTETHLNELLTTAEAGRTATAEEIANSRTSEMHGKVTLYGGTLRVEEQAVLKTTAGLDVAAGSNATVKVSNATLDAGSSDINVGDSGTLTLMNGATVKAANINIADGATFAVVEAPSQEAVATFSLREAVSVAEPPQSCLVGANLTFEAGSTLVADGVYFSMTEGSTLTFKALTGGDKINLVLTLGAEYSDNEQVVLFSDVDVVRFILDGVELNTTDTILANTFFTGAWVNDETTLSYDSSNGTISVQHLNTVTIPEPTTATLSLLALAALAARRRRASC